MLGCLTCGHFVCVCVVEQLHEVTCKYRAAALSPLGVPCEHDRDVCPICDPCTCQDSGSVGARLSRIEEKLQPGSSVEISRSEALFLLRLVQQYHRRLQIFSEEAKIERHEFAEMQHRVERVLRYAEKQHPMVSKQIRHILKS